MRMPGIANMVVMIHLNCESMRLLVSSIAVSQAGLFMHTLAQVLSLLAHIVPPPSRDRDY